MLICDYQIGRQVFIHQIIKGKGLNVIELLEKDSLISSVKSLIHLCHCC